MLNDGGFKSSNNAFCSSSERSSQIRWPPFVCDQLHCMARSTTLHIMLCTRKRSRGYGAAEHMSEQEASEERFVPKDGLRLRSSAIQSTIGGLPATNAHKKQARWVDWPY